MEGGACAQNRQECSLSTIKCDDIFLELVAQNPLRVGYFEGTEEIHPFGTHTFQNSHLINRDRRLDTALDQLEHKLDTLNPQLHVERLHLEIRRRLSRSQFRISPLLNPLVDETRGQQKQETCYDTRRVPEESGNIIVRLIIRT